MGVLLYPPEENGLQKTLSLQLDEGETDSATLSNTTGIQNKPGVVVINRIDSDGDLLATSAREWIKYEGTSGSTLTGLTRGQGGSSDKDHSVGAIVEFIPDVVWAQSVIDLLRYKEATMYAIRDSEDLTAGDGAFYMTIPSYLDEAELSAVHARVITAPVGEDVQIQVHNVSDAVDMLSTPITIDDGETGSDTSATPAVIDTDNDALATNDLIRIDIDQIGSSTAGKGLIIRLQFEI